FARGINWASALEVAFRALSWSWSYHFAGANFREAFRRQFLSALYQHGCYLEHNFSVYFSPNTHLLGEALVLHALGTFFPQWPRASQWRQQGGRTMGQEMERQVRDDGSHIEQSTYYHVYALDMFLTHAWLASDRITPAYRTRMERM